MSIKSVLSENGITELLKLAITKNKIKVNFTLEVKNINLDNRYNNSFCTVTLEDQTAKYSGFILKGNSSDISVKQGDYITITYVSITIMGINSNKIIIINQYHLAKRISETQGDKTINKNYNNNKEKINYNLDSNLSKLLSSLSPSSEENNQLWYSNSDTNKAKNNKLDIVKKSTTSPSLNDNKEINWNDQSINLQDIVPNEIEFTKLSEINTYCKGIRIYVKITKLNEIKTFSNKHLNKQSKIWSFNICDQTGYAMQAAVFDSGIDNFNNILRLNEIYYIIGGYAKWTEKKFSNLESNFRWVFDANTKIYHIPKSFDKLFPNSVSSSMSEIKHFSIAITKFDIIHDLSDKTIINALACILEISPPQLKPSRIGQVSLRSMLLGDNSRFKVDITLWKAFSTMDLKKGDIWLLQDIRVCDYNGSKVLSTIDSSNIYVNPNTVSPPISSDMLIINQLNSLKEIIVTSKSDVNFWSAIPKDEVMKCNNKNTTKDNGWKPYNSTSNKWVPKEKSNVPTFYFQNCFNWISKDNKDSTLARIKGIIVSISHSNKNYFFGCHKTTCKKKVIIDESSGKWKCTFCKSLYDQPYYYYTIVLGVRDITREVCMDLFGDNVMKLFGISCEDYKNWIENNNQIKWKEISEKVWYTKYWFTGKAKINIYNNVIKKKFFAYKYEEVIERNEAWETIEKMKKILLD